MYSFLDFLAEQGQRQKDTRTRREQQTQVKDKVRDSTLDDLERKINAAGQTTNPLEKPAQQQDTEQRGKVGAKPYVAGSARTRQKVAGLEMPAGAGEKLSALATSGLEDVISDEEAARRANVDIRARNINAQTPDTAGEIPTETKIETLPAVINKQIANASREMSSAKHVPEPEWMQIRDLPGYLLSAIRALGRNVFDAFTTENLEDILVLANLGGMGPSSTTEINVVANFLKKHGTRDRDAELDFQQVIPEYMAKVSIWNIAGAQIMLVEDFAGRYIYMWPEDTVKSPEDRADGVKNKHGALGQPQRRLGRF